MDAASAVCFARDEARTFANQTEIRSAKGDSPDKGWQVPDEWRILRSMQVFVTGTYERAVRKLISEGARREMEVAIVADPDGAPIIRGTGGIRKLCWAGSGRGKRGGIRAIYFHHAGPGDIYLLTAYAKAERDDLTSTDRKALSRLVARIQEEGADR